MAPDHLDECLNIEQSRAEREILDRMLLINAGLSEFEAHRIAAETARDRVAELLMRAKRDCRPKTAA